MNRNEGLEELVDVRLRWGIAVVGIWCVVAHMSIRDRPGYLNHATNRPVKKSLEVHAAGEPAVFPLIDPSTGTSSSPREDVVQNRMRRLSCDLMTVRESGAVARVDLAGD